jgi:hypothetical protein
MPLERRQRIHTSAIGLRPGSCKGEEGQLQVVQPFELLDTRHSWFGTTQYASVRQGPVNVPCARLQNLIYYYRSLLVTVHPPW